LVCSVWFRTGLREKKNTSSSIAIQNMHGQVKVRRSPEQDAQHREIESEAKRRFSLLVEEVLAKRRSGIFDLELLEKLAELLEQSPEMFTMWNYQLLEQSPEMFTMWNYRREILLNTVNFDLPTDARSRIFDDELTLTSRCFLKNSKSYATWHHRRWIMLHHPRPDWKNELDLCNKALRLDGRNFHCWDYRRFVVESSRTPNTTELYFTYMTLEENFSNYSAWHYRSGLIGADDEVCTVATPVSPPPTFEVDRKNEISDFPWDEFDLVHNAVFTDPKDQGPWFYYSWLLGRGVKNCYLRELYLSRSLQRAVLVFTSPKLKSAISHLHVDISVRNPSTNTLNSYTPSNLDGWKSALNDNISAVWWFELPKTIIDGCTVSVTVHSEERGDKTAVCSSTVEDSKTWLFCKMEADQKESLTRVALDPRRLLNFMVSPVHEPSSLMGELDTVRELVALEPNNKWALFTLVNLLRYIRPPNCANEIEAAVETLKTVDGHRKRYYADMASAHATEDALVASFAVNSRVLNLSGVGLTRVCCLDWCSLMTDLNFSNNNLDMLPGTCAYLVCLKELNLDDNRISSLGPIAGLPQLKHVSVCRNLIIHFEGLEPILSCPNLRDLDITGNRVAELSNFTVLLAEHPYSKGSHNSLSVVYNKPVKT
uniref:Geranylgeranyl transferase type-2 subunit alpha n=1 Tax=Hydatigena taeniaeformis TaxID=6205 RepID=A0A0R3X965_HYDTA